MIKNNHFVFAYKDSGGLAGARTGSAVVTLTVTTVNGYDPVCSSPVDVTINENQFAIGDTIASVNILWLEISSCISFSILY